MRKTPKRSRNCERKRLNAIENAPEAPLPGCFLVGCWWKNCKRVILRREPPKNPVISCLCHPGLSLPRTCSGVPCRLFSLPSPSSVTPHLLQGRHYELSLRLSCPPPSGHLLLKKCATRHGVPRPAIPWPARPEDFCLQNVNNLSHGGIHPVFNEKSEKK